MDYRLLDDLIVKGLKWLLATAVFGSLMGLITYTLVIVALPATREYPDLILPMVIGFAIAVGLPPHYAPVVNRDLGLILSLAARIIAAFLTSLMLLGIVLIASYYFSPALNAFISANWVTVLALATVITLVQHVIDPCWVRFRKFLG